MKVVIADPKNGKSYQTEIDDNKSRAMYGTRIGEELDGSLIGLTGYKLKVTGGTDKDGFPMRPDVHGPERKRILISSGPGLKTKRKGERRKKTVRGNILSESIEQVNVSVTSAGNKSIAECLGIGEKAEEKPEEQKEVVEEKKEEVKEEPKEQPEEEKKKEDIKKEKPEKVKEEKVEDSEQKEEGN